MNDKTNGSENCLTWELPTFEVPQNLNKTMITALKNATQNQDKIIEEHRQKGFDAGYAAGLQKAQSEIETLYQVMTESVAQLKTYELFFNEELENKLLEFCQAITKLALEQELIHSKEYLVKWIKKGVENFSNADTPISIKLNSLILEQLKSLNLNFDPNITIEFVADDKLSVGEQTVTCGKSEMILSIDNLVASICRDLK